MTPYYRDDLVTLYHGDCREWSELPGDVMVTDPPYGYGYASGRDDSPWQNRPIANDDSLDVRDVMVARWGQRPALVFGSWKMPPPFGAKAALVWDKGLASGMGDLSMPWKAELGAHLRHRLRLRRKARLGSSVGRRLQRRHMGQQGSLAPE